MASEDAVVTQGLECCVCCEYFSEPKVLACGHTFCKKCLDRLYTCNPQQNQLYCPLCRQITEVNNGDISKLQTNIQIKSLVEDMKAAKNSCTACDPEAKSPAVQYCAQCHEYMCEPCAVDHGKFKKTAKHDAVSMDDVMKGKVKVKRFCTKHPEEEKLYVCTPCRVSICFRCHVLDHSKPDHDIKDVSDYKKTTQKQIESLQTKATTKISMIEEHAELVKQQRAVFEVEHDQKMAKIKQSYEEDMKNLTTQHDDLLDQCKQEKATRIAQLEKIKESDDTTMSCIRSASELVGNGNKALLVGQTLAVHNTICCELEKMLDETNPDAIQPYTNDTQNGHGQWRRVVRLIGGAHKLFKGHTLCISLLVLICSHYMYVLSFSSGLGDLQQHNWQLEKGNVLPRSKDHVMYAVKLSDELFASGFVDRERIKRFTDDGPQETVPGGENSECSYILSDGSVVGRYEDNNITLHPPFDHAEIVQFDTLSQNIGGYGGMCVDRDDKIYVGYGMIRKIVVFQREGGAPFREIPCHGYDPWQICHMKRSKRLVVYDGRKSVRVIDDTDEEGTVLHHTQVDSGYTHIAVLEDDTILIGWWKAGLLSIELYTKELERIRTVLSGFPLEDYFIHLAEMPNGGILVASAKQSIVFNKIWWVLPE